MVTTRRHTRTGRLETEQHWQNALYKAHVINKLRRAFARGQIRSFVNRSRNAHHSNHSFEFDSNNDDATINATPPNNTNDQTDMYRDSDHCHRHRKEDGDPKSVTVERYTRRRARR